MSETGKTILSEELMTAAVGVLGSMLIDENAVGPMLLAVEESDFQLPEHRHVFAAIRDLFRHGRPVDATLVNEALGRGYERLLADLMDRTPTAVHADAYAEALKRTSRLWQLRQLGDALSALDEEEHGRALIDRASARCEEILRRRRQELEVTARYLLDHETMDGETFAKVFDDPKAEELAPYLGSES